MATLMLSANVRSYIIIVVAFRFLHPWPVRMIVINHNWVAMRSAILYMRMTIWKIIMGVLKRCCVVLRPKNDPANHPSSRQRCKGSECRCGSSDSN